MAVFGDIPFMAIIYFVLFLDALAAKPLGVPFFALRRHQTSMRHKFGAIPQTGTDVFGTQFLTSGMRAGRSKPVPSYGAGLMNDDGDQNVPFPQVPVEVVVKEEYEPTSPPSTPPPLTQPPPSFVAVNRPQYPLNIPSESADTYLSSLPSRSLIDKIEHPIAAHRFKMNVQCLLDPPVKSRYARNAVIEKPIIFYSFNPAGQSCDKLIMDEGNLATSGPNVYPSLKECQLDCCPTALCLRM